MDADAQSPLGRTGKAHGTEEVIQPILGAAGFELTVIRDWFIISGGDHQMKPHARTKRSP
jgi:hypothetical protein